MLIPPLQEYPKRTKKQDNGTSHSHVLYTPGWCVDCGHGVDVWYLSLRVIPLREPYPAVSNVASTHWYT
jgi:hypothetical protein